VSGVCGGEEVVKLALRGEENLCCGALSTFGNLSLTTKQLFSPLEVVLIPA